MGTPDARAEDAFVHRLREAYQRYDSARQHARPGTAGAARLARARLDLVLLLDSAGEQLPADVLTQIDLDSAELVRTTPPLA